LIVAPHPGSFHPPGGWDGSQSFAQGACYAVDPLDASTPSINSSGGRAGNQIRSNWQIGPS
jgi:hypothetical protein